ncbi:uncharacterized protein DS421_18g627680 [Arachis hypogaea]|nr:uncharacterized protein DS421_18g627680 [Arachis hypogaea]
MDSPAFIKNTCFNAPVPLIYIMCILLAKSDTVFYFKCNIIRCSNNPKIFINSFMKFSNCRINNYCSNYKKCNQM